MKIFVYYGSAGHGHQKVAEVIGRALIARGVKPEEIKVQDALQKTSLLFRHTYPATYFWAVKDLPKVWGWFYETFDRAGIYPAVKPFRRILNKIEERKMMEEVRREQPDFIICTHFFPAEVFAAAKKKGLIQATLITVITDFFPHFFWVNDGTDYYWVMSEETKEDLIGRNVPREQIIPGGIPADPVFKPSGRKHEILKKWGFSTGRFTVLLTSGSFGLAPHDEILKSLEVFSDRIQCFVVCGHNQSLQARLESAHYPFPVKVFGFVDFMPELMEASDLLIAKSGGSTTVESLMKEIPMVVFQPIPGQEMRNARLLKDYHASFFMEKPEQIRTILQTILDNPKLMDDKRKSIRSMAKPNAAEDLATFVLDEARKVD
ncbi:MAG TPA: glycosyltransferase [bacterium]|nr:glycosyltransferase [bacterium]